MGGRSAALILYATLLSGLCSTAARTATAGPAAAAAPQQLEEIANEKMEDLNANDLKQAKKIIAGTARSMGIDA